MEFLAYFLILLWAIIELSIIKGEDVNVYGVNLSSAKSTTFDVSRFGAVGDGTTDDSKAFNLAWAAACRNTVNNDSVKISVPFGKTFLISPIEFGGPCKCRTIIFEILGTIVAPPKLEWKNKNRGEWLKFQGVNHLNVVGNEVGVIDGQGNSWWKDENNARPIAILFVGCNNFQIMGLTHVNSPKFHLSISDCNNATVSKLRMSAPSNSPNTDGIDLLSSTNITIHNCTMETGDDCIAIKGGTSHVNISDIACGPGHGISIGSLGQSGKIDKVEAINIKNCNITRTTNGIRIKTWQGGSGFARNINFSNIIFTMVNNPVVIDQFYCPHKICSNKESAVNVSDVRYKGLSGTSAPRTTTISLRCSDVVPCRNIVVDGLNIKSSDGTKPIAVCLNAYGIARNVTSPPLDCLRK